MSRRDKTSMVWATETVFATLSPLSATFGQEIITDPEGATIAPSLYLRTILSVNVRCTNLQSTADIPPFLGIGVVRTDPLVPTVGANAITPLNSGDADRSWLFRHFYPLPWLPDGQAFNGSPLTQNVPWTLDWKIHNGRGSNISKDVQIRWTMELRVFAGIVNVALQAMHLFKTY